MMMDDDNPNQNGGNDRISNLYHLHCGARSKFVRGIKQLAMKIEPVTQMDGMDDDE